MQNRKAIRIHKQRQKQNPRAMCVVYKSLIHLALLLVILTIYLVHTINTRIRVGLSLSLSLSLSVCVCVFHLKPSRTNKRGWLYRETKEINLINLIYTLIVDLY